MILNRAGISNAYIYSNLDPTARKISAAKFNNGKVAVLVVTDVAARGIDIPKLDFVINYNFPAKSKLFVHRVGRCARAGRSGTAISIVSTDEHSYLLDLHLFLGRELKLCSAEYNDVKEEDGRVGDIPPSVLELQQAELLLWHKNEIDLSNMKKVCNNAYEKYLRSRPAASHDSNKRTKELDLCNLGHHPMFKALFNVEHANMLAQMKNYRPPGTVFEIGAKSSATDYIVMKAKRAYHKSNILNHHKKKAELLAEKAVLAKQNDVTHRIALPSSSETDIKDTFGKIIMPKIRKMDQLYQPKQKKQKVIKDEEFYIPYASADKHTEEGLSVNFQQEANKVQFDLTADSEEQQNRSRQLMKWDRKKKKMVADNKNSKVGKIKTESGKWIPATYKSTRYAQWKQKSKVDEDNNGSDDNNETISKGPQKALTTHWARHNENMKSKAHDKELKRPEHILKQRKIAAKKKSMLMNKGKRKGKGKPRGKSGGRR